VAGYKGNKDFDACTLPKDYEDLRASIRELAEEQIAPHAHDVDEQGRFPKEALDALRGAGFDAPHVPEEYGGQGADALATVIVVEEIARVCMSSSLIPSVNKLGSMPLMLCGSKELKQKYLTKLAMGEGMFSYCLSEPEAGSDAGGMSTRARRDGDQWVINGAKRWITNAGESEFYTVFAVTDPEKRTRGGISAFVVEKNDAGISFGAPERKLGIKGSPTREVFFDDVRVGDDRLIGSPGTGFTTAMCTLDHTRITIGAQALGVAQGALDYACGYMQERKQFGKAISEFQGLQFMIADMAMQVEAARQLVYAAAAKSEREDKDLTYFGAAAKAYASDVAMKVTTDAVQLLGGYGYVKDYPVERMMRDAKITQIYEGTNQVQRVVIARQLLHPHTSGRAGRAGAAAG
jgi:alkylation response protein AidB-like acyl-CoA dehydrogenase